MSYPPPLTRSAGFRRQQFNIRSVVKLCTNKVFGMAAVDYNVSRHS